MGYYHLHFDNSSKYGGRCFQKRVKVSSDEEMNYQHKSHSSSGWEVVIFYFGLESNPDIDVYNTYSAEYKHQKWGDLYDRFGEPILEKGNKESKTKSKYKKEKQDNGKSFEEKLLLAPFKIVFWVLKLVWKILKTILSLFGLGFIFNMFSDDE